MTITKSQRRLVLVNSLSRYRTGVWKVIYQSGEWAGKTITMTALDDDYAHIHPCTGGFATRSRFLSRLKAAATSPGTKAVDVFCQLHGSDDVFHFYDEDVQATRLRDDILALGLPDNLRLFYNTCCYGDSQNSNEMLEAGFATTIGSKRINCTAAVEFPIFCSMWQLNSKVADIMALADNPVTRAAMDATIKATTPMKDTDSQKVVRGNAALRISSSP